MSAVGFKTGEGGSVPTIWSDAVWIRWWAGDCAPLPTLQITPGPFGFFAVEMSGDACG